MTGDLTIQKANAGFAWKDMNGNTERRRVFVGMANSGGNFYIYDNTNGKDIIISTLAGESIFNGRLADGAGYEKLNVAYGMTAATDKKYWAYRIGNLVYVNIRCKLTSDQPANFPLAKLTRSDGTVIKPIIDNSNVSFAQVLGGNGATTNASNGFNIIVTSALASGSGVNVFGVFMCQ